MNARTCCFTSANFAYLSRARVLATTFKEYNPDIDFILLLVDIEPPDFALDLEREPFDRVLRADAIDIPDFNSWSFKHNVIELCTAVKASCAKHLLGEYEKVIYLDPDIAVFHTFSTITQALDAFDIVLTPHQLTPCADQEAEIIDVELSTLKHGLFNLGFFAVADRAQGRAFVEWWESRLLRWCYDDVPSGLFTDQKWCNMAPGYFSRLHILRDFGCNVASWNLYERAIEYQDDHLVVNGGDILKFYHFTKHGGLGDAMTERYARSDTTLELWHWYGMKLRQFGLDTPPADYYHYGQYGDGSRIDDRDRIAYRAEYRPGLPNPYIGRRPGQGKV